jgi:hypothetical protein
MDRPAKRPKTSHPSKKPLSSYDFLTDSPTLTIPPYLSDDEEDSELVAAHMSFLRSQQSSPELEAAKQEIRQMAEEVNALFAKLTT